MECLYVDVELNQRAYLGGAMWYLFQRGLQMIVILFALSAALFGLLTAMPGNPVDLLITSNPNIKPQDVARLKKLRGLDKPWYIQYVRWLWGYPDPARPPVILPIAAINVPPQTSKLRIELGSYISDPNFEPDEQQLKKWLLQIWPDWEKSNLSADINEYLSKKNVSDLLLVVASHNLSLQNQLMALIEEAGAKKLKLTGLFGAQAEGLSLSFDPQLKDEVWFKIENSYGQEKIGHFLLRHGSKELNNRNYIKPITTQLVENDERVFELDLKKFLINPEQRDLSFKLIDSSLGELDSQGHYRNFFEKAGQSVIAVQVSDQNGANQKFAFDIEHGVIANQHKFNRGFLFFFVGDQKALGFSQAYKRPVYELLFGTPAICGDNNISPSESCDDGNRIDGDGCSSKCLRENDSLIQRADTRMSGYIMSTGRIGNTIQLMLPALLLSLLIAIPLGVLSAYRQYSRLDYVVNFLAFVGISLPVFWFGIMMIYLFAENWQLFPAGGVQTPGIYGLNTFEIIGDRLKYAVLPTMVLSIFYVGRWLRYMRASMLEVLPKDYIRTARAKGLSESKVILKHAFRNALIPVVTVLALSLPSLFGGAVLTETVFSWPGVGRMQYDAVLNSDYYVAIVVFLISAVLVMVGNLLADALYVLVDPRIRKQ